MSVGAHLYIDLRSSEWEPGIEVEDLSYGPIAVVQNLEDRPRYDRMIFVAAVKRDRVPGDFYRGEWRQPLPSEEEIQARIGEAVTGVIDLENLLVVAQYFRVLAPEIVVIEVEPAEWESGENLSPIVAGMLPNILRTVKREAHGTAHSGIGA